jgi:hypothetical protein
MVLDVFGALKDNIQEERSLVESNDRHMKFMKTKRIFKALSSHFWHKKEGRIAQETLKQQTKVNT